jgi:hypothetical protein
MASRRKASGCEKSTALGAREFRSGRARARAGQLLAARSASRRSSLVLFLESGNHIAAAFGTFAARVVLSARDYHNWEISP